MNKLVAFGVAGVVLVGGGYIGWQWYQAQHNQLSTPPERRAEAASIAPQPSSIALRLRMPFATLQQAIQKSVPTSFVQPWTNGEDLCKFRICVGTRYQFTVTRGAVGLKKSGELLEVSMPLSVSGQGGFRGDVADILDADAKNFNAAAIVASGLGVRIGQDWCPLVDIKPAYHWTQNPRVEIVSRVWISIGDLVSKEVDKELAKLPGQVQQAIPCDRIRSEVQKAWKSYDIPVQVPDGPLVHVHLQPQSIGASKLIVADDHLRLAVALKTIAEVSTSAAATAPPGTLPPPEEAADAPGLVQVSLPLRVGYKQAEEEIMRRFGNKPIEFTVEGQKGSVTITAVTLYPAGPSLAVGLTFSADIPGRLFDTKGQVFVSARPVIDQGGKTLRMTDISLRRDLDSPLWNAVTAFFDSQLRSELEKLSVIDLREPVEQGKKALQAALADPAKTGGIKLTVTDVDAALEQVVPAEDDLVVVTKLNATVDAELAEIRF
ncbi:MAG TPA: DUF4403 family protein [Roseomonas sp.]|nr:DUF4403 family protein [Roseomonas sp.]